MKNRLDVVSVLAFGAFCFLVSACNDGTEFFEDQQPIEGRKLFVDDFETDKGWLLDPTNTDNATAGMWERANPQQTEYDGYVFQLNKTASGTRALVTGALAGSSVGDNDLDGGVSTIRSRTIRLPDTNNPINIVMKYTFAHHNNADPNDYLIVSVVGTSEMILVEEYGEDRIREGEWKSIFSDISRFEGEDVYILVEAADNDNASLIEAAVDDIEIVERDNQRNRSEPRPRRRMPPPPIFAD
jgi:glycine cleavage system regulatory protein